MEKKFTLESALHMKYSDVWRGSKLANEIKSALDKNGFVLNGDDYSSKRDHIYIEDKTYFFSDYINKSYEKYQSITTDELLMVLESLPSLDEYKKEYNEAKQLLKSPIYIAAQKIVEEYSIMKNEIKERDIIIRQLSNRGHCDHKNSYATEWHQNGSIDRTYCPDCGI